MEMEERAKQMGWTPQEEFRGNPDNWVDAETFVERAETSLPIAKGTIKHLENEIVGLKKALTGLAEHHKTVAEREYAKALKAIENKQKQAVREGDEELFAEAQSELKELKDHPLVSGQQPTPAATTTRPEAVDEWMRQNDWYSTDFDMANYANQYDQWLRNGQPNLSTEDHLAKVTAAVKKKFPDRFDNGTGDRRNAPAMMEGGDGLATVNRRGKSYHNLPKEAREVCDSLVSQKVMTKEQYVKEYFGE